MITYNNLYRTQYPYIDSWIIGRNREDIEEKYGEPQINSDTLIGYYIGENNGFLGTMTSSDEFVFRCINHVITLGTFWIEL